MAGTPAWPVSVHTLIAGLYVTWQLCHSQPALNWFICERAQKMAGLATSGLVRTIAVIPGWRLMTGEKKTELPPLNQRPELLRNTSFAVRFPG